jgi:hypothetical protein
VVPYGHTNRNDAANCCFCSCFTNVPKLKECDIMCLFRYCSGTICSCPTYVVAEQQSSSGHTLSYIRNCIWHVKTSRLFDKIVTNHIRQNDESLVFSMFVSHYYWSFHKCITVGKGCWKCHISPFVCHS